MGAFEVLEHTADVGIRAWGASLAEAFEQAGWGLAEILGVREGLPGVAGERRDVRIDGEDDGALLVDFLNELVVLHETEEAGFHRILVHRAGQGRVEAEVVVVPLSGEPDGTAVKAATYHQLRVDTDADGAARVQIYLDV